MSYVIQYKNISSYTCLNPYKDVWASSKYIYVPIL